MCLGILVFRNVTYDKLPTKLLLQLGIRTVDAFCSALRLEYIYFPNFQGHRFLIQPITADIGALVTGLASQNARKHS